MIKYYFFKFTIQRYRVFCIIMLYYLSIDLYNFKNLYIVNRFTFLFFYLFKMRRTKTGYSFKLP
jgi:hypothetical protein